VFRADLIVNEFKQIRFIGLIGCLIMNVPIVTAATCGVHCSVNVIMIMYVP